MKRRLIAATGSMLLLAGCVGVPDKEGWHYTQKRTFMKILEEDRYLSLCDDRALYEKVKQSGDTRLMSKLLVEYTRNLANGCIDIASFKAAQRARRNDDFHTDYKIYREKVDPNRILAQLRQGVSIERILQPYVPKYREFDRLSKAYREQREAGASPTALHKLRLSLERIKWMKPLAGENYALINIPEFAVRIIEKGKTKVKMRVVTGKRTMQTPVFSENLQYIVLNPPWNVPPSIMRKEMLPKLIKNPGYLKRKGMEAHRSYDLNSPKVDLSTFDLSEYLIPKNATEEEKKHLKPLPFRFVQLPSKKNGLGRVKFLFPNHYSVYMHDTQSKYLFKRKYRAYSHGCIRLEKPNTMLHYIAKHYTDTPKEEVQKMYDDGKTHFIRLTKLLPVHTAYLTAYVEDNGTVRYFDDIYGYDKLQKLKF